MYLDFGHLSSSMKRQTWVAKSQESPVTDRFDRTSAVRIAGAERLKWGRQRPATMSRICELSRPVQPELPRELAGIKTSFQFAPLHRCELWLTASIFDPVKGRNRNGKCPQPCRYVLTRLARGDPAKECMYSGGDVALPKPLCQVPLPARVISTRRFSARPSGVSLEATGAVSPKPCSDTRFGFTP